MLNKLYNWLFANNTKQEDEWKAYKETQERICEKQKLDHKAEYELKKVQWEAKNELAKKHDACNLGFTKTHFNGTYEEYLDSARHSQLGILQYAAYQNQQSQAAQAAQGMNPYISGFSQHQLGGLFR